MSKVVSQTPSELKYTINWLNAAFLFVTPIAAFCAAIWHSKTYGVGWIEFTVFFIWYVFCGLSITAGYHRLFAHRSHDAASPLILFYSLFGAGAFQNSIIEWCADHRAHHKMTDTENDPYNAKRGFLWSHIGWIVMEDDIEDDFSSVRDLMENPIIAWQHRHIFLIGFLVGMVLPGLVGYLIGGVGVGIGCFIWGGLIRTVFVHHGTFLINSAAHIWGRQTYSLKDTSRDSALLSLFTFGEGYHNFHHTFQADYRNGHKWYHWDPSKWWISSFSFVKIIRNLKRARKESIEVAKLDVKYAREVDKIMKVDDEIDVSQFDSRINRYRNSLRLVMRKMADARKEFKIPKIEINKQTLSYQLKQMRSEIRTIKLEISELFKDMRNSREVVSA